MAKIDDQLLIAKPCPPGSGCTFTWTLVSQFGRMIEEVEALFGPRNRDYTILGIEFSGSIPQIWFPFDCRHIAIQLGEPSMKDAKRARFQLAHETVHLLDPVVAGSATVLEEGLATYYQLKYIHREDSTYSTGQPKYDSASRLASKLMAAQPDAVKVLRSQGKRISALTVDELLGACSDLTRGEAMALAQTFVEWNGDTVQPGVGGGGGGPPPPPPQHQDVGRRIPA
jgi:hypothetical protein